MQKSEGQMIIHFMDNVLFRTLKWDITCSVNILNRVVPWEYYQRNYRLTSTYYCIYLSYLQICTANRLICAWKIPNCWLSAFMLPWLLFTVTSVYSTVHSIRHWSIKKHLIEYPDRSKPSSWQKKTQIILLLFFEIYYSTGWMFSKNKK